jgi:hypothetical protein
VRNYDAPHYAVLSDLLFVPVSCVQIFSSVKKNKREADKHLPAAADEIA